MQKFLTEEERDVLRKKVFENRGWYVIQDHSRESGPMVLPFKTKQEATDYIMPFLSDSTKDSFNPDSKYIFGNYGWHFEIFTKENLPERYIKLIPPLKDLD